MLAAEMKIPKILQGEGMMDNKKYEDWQIEQTEKYLGGIVNYKGITYQIIDCIEERGFVTGKTSAGYKTIKIKKIPISKIKKYF